MFKDCRQASKPPLARAGDIFESVFQKVSDLAGDIFPVSSCLNRGRKERREGEK
jgi:hypothetical protein